MSSYKEYSINRAMAERCLGSSGPAYGIFIDYLSKITNDSSLRYDKDFYLHYVSRLLNALEGKKISEELN